MGYPTKSGIYKIQNTENGMCYIGQSVNISHRVSQHLSELKLMRSNGVQPTAEAFNENY